MDKEIYVLGIGRNSITMIDLAEDCGYRIAGLLHYNHDCIGENYFGYRIGGCFEDLFAENSIKGKNFLITMGDISIRETLFNRIVGYGGAVPSLIHPSAVVSRHAQIGSGVLVMPQSVIQADVKVGDNSVLTLSSQLTHSSVVGNHCFISGHSLVGAYVNMGDRVWIGQGAVIVSGEVGSIGNDAIIGAGSVLRTNAKPNCVYLGNPARLVRVRE